MITFYPHNIMTEIINNRNNKFGSIFCKCKYFTQLIVSLVIKITKNSMMNDNY